MGCAPTSLNVQREPCRTSARHLAATGTLSVLFLLPLAAPTSFLSANAGHSVWEAARQGPLWSPHHFGQAVEKRSQVQINREQDQALSSL